MLWVYDYYGGDCVIDFVCVFYCVLFVDDINIGELVEVMKIVDVMGIDGVVFNVGVSSQQIKDQFKVEIDLVMLCGVFGLFYVIVDGEVFWGFDCFDQIEVLLCDGCI